ncbi:uncharacterized protein LOC108673504 [Hyalella azteca]|uniref:Uncharacterized protein LOC108673504 n=1 Tax=Hyalella azteca TaxID=294128 RepID=A0A8B7NV61_HYAAZ|nr:uncharacterized protein LOC108673504 [Hyalella azteca]
MTSQATDRTRLSYAPPMAGQLSAHHCVTAKFKSEHNKNYRQLASLPNAIQIKHAVNDNLHGSAEGHDPVTDSRLCSENQQNDLRYREKLKINGRNAHAPKNGKQNRYMLKTCNRSELDSLHFKELEPEYMIWPKQQDECSDELENVNIMRQRINTEEAMEQNRLIPCETNLLPTWVWSRGRSIWNFSPVCAVITQFLIISALLGLSESASRLSVSQQPRISSNQAYYLAWRPEVTLHRADRTYFAAPTVNYNERKLVMQQQYKSGRSVDDVPARDQSTHYLSNNFKRNIADNTGVSDNELLYPVTEELRTQDEENALHYRLQREREEAARKWAPIVWLHPNEIFFPGDVLDFLRHVNVSSVDDAEDVAYLRELELPQGPVTEDMYLTAPLDTECCNCPLPAFLHGQRPIRGEGPPVYAHIHACYTPLTSPTRTLPMELLLEPSPEGKLIEARSLRHQIQTLQHPLPRYRRRRLRARARGRRSIPGQENGFEQEIVPGGEDQRAIIRQNRKLISAQESTVAQSLESPLKRDEEEDSRVIGINVNSGHSAAKFDNALNQTEPPTIITRQQESSGAVRNTNFTADATLSQRGYDASQNDSDNISGSKAQLDTESPATTQQPLNGPATSQPIIIIENYSRTHVHETRSFIDNLNVNHSINTNDTSFKDPSNSTQQFKEPTRRHASLTTGTHGHHFTITYWFFYPYNHGKEICTTSMIFIGRVAKPLYKGKCHGETVVMGNHVGDWEHLSIYFEDGEPRHLYLSAHNFGAFYTYQPAWNRFEYTNQDVREGVFMKAKYPRYLELQQGRLVVYSARGSHGTWPHKGVHLYNDVMVRLEDEAEQGYLWDTRHRVHVIDSLAEKRGKPIGTHGKWFDFRGKWGNPSSNCHPGMLGYCELRDGPLGITMKRLNFPCHIPRHYTFPKP